MSVVFESEVPDGIVSVGGYRSTVEELLDLLRGPAWQADALCKEYPNLAWFGSPTAPRRPPRRSVPRVWSAPNA